MTLRTPMKYGALILATCTLVACGGTSDEEGSSRASSMYTWIGNENDREQWQAFVDAASEHDPSFELEIEGPAITDYYTTVQTRMSAADAPCIITTQGPRTQELASLLMPLNDLADEHGMDIGQYNAGMIEAMTVDGTVRAIPFGAEPLVLYYNKDFLQEAGVAEPTIGYTTDQFLADLQALTTDDHRGIATAALFQYGPAMPLAFANGNTPVENNELTLTDPDFVADVQWTFDLVAEHGVAVAPNSGDPSDAAIQEFIAGETATLIGGTWFYETIVGGAPGEVGIAPVPSHDGETRGMITGSGFGIAQTCDDPDAAFETLAALTTPEVLETVAAQRGNVPAAAAAMDAWSEGKPEQAVEVVTTVLANARALMVTPEWSQVETMFSQHASDGYRGVSTAEEILTTIEDSVRR